MKRSKQTAFMPNSFVFPGGVVEKCDDSVDWIELYKTLGETTERMNELTSADGKRPLIFQKKENSAIARCGNNLFDREKRFSESFVSEKFHYG